MVAISIFSVSTMSRTLLPFKKKISQSPGLTSPLGSLTSTTLPPEVSLALGGNGSPFLSPF